jgi:hypothetical protein
MNYKLPRKDNCSLSFMLEILSGLKLGLKTTKDDDAKEFKPHLESLHLLLA